MSRSEYSSDYDNYTSSCYCNKCIRERESQRNCQCNTCRHKNVKIYDRCNCYRCYQQRTSSKKKCQNECQYECQHDTHNDNDDCKKGKVIVITIN